MPEARLGDVAVEGGLIGGPFGSNLVSDDYTDVGIPVIRGANLSFGRTIGGDYAFVSIEKYQRDLRRNTALPGDIVYTQRGTLGQVGLVPMDEYPQYVISQSQMRLRVDSLKADSRFVFYACTTSQFKRQIADRAISTGVPHINLSILGDLRIPLPSIPTQHAIAAALGALDDKIEANRKLAAIADALAVAVFRKFVHRATASSLTFADVANIGGGGTPKSKVEEFWGGDINWLTPTDVTVLPGPYVSSTSRTITQAGFDTISSDLYPVGSIAMTSRATIGAFAMLDAPMAVNQGFIVVNAKEAEASYWLFHDMRDRVPEFLDHANGATFMELSRGNFKKLPARMLDKAAMCEFDSVVRPIHDSARAALTENQHLARLRDTLLPKLMSGELRVRDAEDAVAAAV